MEMVTQKYLRNEYATIEEYNAVAEEVAEPYRVLVVADFPGQVRREVGGPAGGDRRRRRPLRRARSWSPPTCPSRCRPASQLDELRPYCARPDLGRRSRLAWDDRDFGRYPLALDPPPPADFATRQIQKVGAAAKDAKRVEVPFEFIAPPADAWWTQRQPSRDRRARSARPARPSGSTSRSGRARRSTS